MNRFPVSRNKTHFLVAAILVSCLMAPPVLLACECLGGHLANGFRQADAAVSPAPVNCCASMCSPNTTPDRTGRDSHCDTHPDCCFTPCAPPIPTAGPGVLQSDLRSSQQAPLMAALPSAFMPRTEPGANRCYREAEPKAANRAPHIASTVLLL